MTSKKLLNGKPGQRCILAIDDDSAIRSSICLFLNDFGYLVLEAANGHSGIELFQQHHPDLILLDLRMPGLSGLAVLKSLREVDPDIPVIVISATGEISDVVEALRYGATDFLLKPIEDLMVLRHSVEKALEESRLRRENHLYHEHLEEIIAQRTATLERTHTQLRQSEEKYRAIYENLQDVYFETTLDGTLLEISPSIEKHSSYLRKELLGSNIWQAYAIPEQREHLLQTLREQQRISDYEILLTDHDGQTIYVSVNAMLHLDDAGQPTHLSGVMRDISERKRAEESLRATNQTLEVLFNAAPLAIIAIDTEQCITLWNLAAEETFGWKRAEVIGHPYPLALSGQEEKSRRNLEESLTGVQFKGLELTRQCKDGQPIDISASTAQLRDTNDSICGAIIISEDISEKKRLRSEADRYSRLASLGELAAGVAHEINNPNGLILLNLPTVRDFVLDAIALQQELADKHENLNLGGLKPERAAEAFPQLMNEVEDSARRIKQIVDDLKAFAGNENLDDEGTFDLNQATQTAIRLTANHLKKATSQLETQLASNLPSLKGSTQRIEQVIINLLVNACDALTDRQQKIRVLTGKNAATHEVFLCICDEGAGIDPQQLAHITDPFFTTRRETGGTGLGLSVSARIIKEYNGRLEFQSTPEQGTSACAYFPIPQ